jgi:hypothetical protein
MLQIHPYLNQPNIFIKKKHILPLKTFFLLHHQIHIPQDHVIPF